MREFFEVLNLMAVPIALMGYIVVLERRLTRVQTQLDMILRTLHAQAPSHPLLSKSD